MKLLAYIAFILMVLFHAGCTLGPDATADVISHAASYSGMAPAFGADGRMTGMMATGVREQRRTMFTP